MKTILRVLVPAICILVLYISSLSACSVPVFRYALERWERDPYPAILLYKGERPDVPEDVEKYLRKLLSLGVITFDMIELSAASEPAKQFESVTSKHSPPLLAIFYPRSPQELKALRIFELGTLTKKNLVPVFESPMREAVAKRIIEGDVAVWVFLEWDGPEKNRQALSVLKTTLKKMEEELNIPEQTDVADESAGMIEALQIKFSVVTVPYDLSDKTGEKIFRDMLLNVESDIADLEGPMAFPIFGQGRALYALIDRGINEENISEACQFLVGPCSCQVKLWNPGMDILFSADWRAGVESLVQLKEEPPPLTGYSAFAPAEEKTSVRIQSGPEKDVGSITNKTIILSVLSVTCLALLSVVVIRFRKGSGTK